MWLMYWILKLDNIISFFSCMQDAFCFLLIIGGIFLAIGFLLLKGCQLLGDDDEKAAARKISKEMLPAVFKIFMLIVLIWIISSICCVFMPTTKQAAAIYFVPKVINNKQIQKMPNKLVMLANSWMDSEMKQIKDATGKK
jgi:hypothetical protein